MAADAASWAPPDFKRQLAKHRAASCRGSPTRPRPRPRARTRLPTARRGPRRARPRGRDPPAQVVRASRVQGGRDRPRARDGLHAARAAAPPRARPPFSASPGPVRGARDARARAAARGDNARALGRRRHARDAAPRVDLEDRRRRLVLVKQYPESKGPYVAVRADRLALLSVSDRTGLVDFARALGGSGFGLLSTGGTAPHLAAAGLAVTNVSDLTGFPEVFGGRVKTLHPKLFGGILFDRSEERTAPRPPSDGVGPIDLVVVNLYPFEETVARTGRRSRRRSRRSTSAGRRSCARPRRTTRTSASSATRRTTPPSRPSCAHGGASRTRRAGELAAKVFRRTAAYDAAIARWISGRDGRARSPSACRSPSRSRRRCATARTRTRRRALYADAGGARRPPSRATRSSRGRSSRTTTSSTPTRRSTRRASSGRTRSRSSSTGSRPARASGTAMAEAFEAAWASDPIAGFGGVVAYTGRSTPRPPLALTSRFLEVVVVHDVTDDAKPILAKKPNLRVLTVTPETGAAPAPRGARHRRRASSCRRATSLPTTSATWKVVTKRAPDERRDARAALREPRPQGRRLERDRRRGRDRDVRHRRRPHEPRRRLPRRGRQGRRAGEGRRRGVGRVLPVPGRSRGARGGGRHGGRPAGRLREGRRRHRRGGRRGNRDGVHGKEALQTLKRAATCSCSRLLPFEARPAQPAGRRPGRDRPRRARRPREHPHGVFVLPVRLLHVRPDVRARRLRRDRARDRAPRPAGARPRALRLRRAGGEGLHVRREGRAPVRRGRPAARREDASRRRTARACRSSFSSRPRRSSRATRRAPPRGERASSRSRSRREPAAT